jgi:hypothetical protein
MQLSRCFIRIIDGLTVAELALEAVVRCGTAGTGLRSLQPRCSVPFPLSAAITR